MEIQLMIIFRSTRNRCASVSFSIPITLIILYSAGNSTKICRIGRQLKIIFVCNLTTFKFFMSKFFEKCEGVVWTSDSIVSWNRFKSTPYVKIKSRIKFDELIICLAVQADN
jgi:hypothetical protein